MANAAPIASTEILTPRQLSEYLGGIPEKTLSNWRSRRLGPVPIKLGGHVRYRLTDVEAWLAEQARDAQTWRAT